MTHAISATFTRYDRMSPTAAALAVLLHVATAFALWWVSPLNRHETLEQAPIEVTIERPQVVPPPTPPAQQTKPPPAPPAARTPLGLPPAPSPTITEKNQPAPPPPLADKTPETKPEPKPEPPKPAAPPEPQPQQQAVAPPPQPEPPVEKALPAIEAPPPPVTSKDFPKVPVPAPAKPHPQPEVHHAPPPPPQAHPSPLQSSPLQASPNKRAPSPNDDSAVTAFVNPAASAARTHAGETYVTQIARKIAQNSFRPRESTLYTRSGVIVVRLVVARNGQLTDVSVAQSTGAPAFDADMMEFIRRLSPFAPLPDVISGNQAAFTLRIPYNFNPDR